MNITTLLHHEANGLTLQDPGQSSPPSNFPSPIAALMALGVARESQRLDLVGDWDQLD